MPVCRMNDDSKEDLKVNSSLQEVGEEDSVIRDLSQALMQVLKMIEAKYLNPPLGKFNCSLRPQQTSPLVFSEAESFSASKLCCCWN